MKTCKLLRLENKKLTEKGLRMGVIDEATALPNLKVCPYSREKGRYVDIIAYGSREDVEKFAERLKSPEQSPTLRRERKNYKIVDCGKYKGKKPDFNYCIAAVGGAQVGRVHEDLKEVVGGIESLGNKMDKGFGDMRKEFSGMRKEMRQGFGEMREGFREVTREVAGEIRKLRSTGVKK